MPRRCPPAVPGTSSRRPGPCPAVPTGRGQPRHRPRGCPAARAAAALAGTGCRGSAGRSVPAVPMPRPRSGERGRRPAEGREGVAPGASPVLASSVTSRRTRGQGVTQPRLPREVGLPALAGFLRGKAAQGPWPDDPWTVSGCAADSLGLSVPQLPAELCGTRLIAVPPRVTLSSRTAPRLLGPKQVHGRLSRRAGIMPLLQAAFSPVALTVFA